MIGAEQAMHQTDNEQSCLGCHEINKQKKNETPLVVTVSV